MRSTATAPIAMMSVLLLGCGAPSPTSFERAQNKAAARDKKSAKATAIHDAERDSLAEAATDLVAARLGLEAIKMKERWTVEVTFNGLAVGLADPDSSLCVLVSHDDGGLAIVGMGSPPSVPPRLGLPTTKAAAPTFGEGIALNEDRNALASWVGTHCGPGTAN